ncbi:HD-GYP domain-containing protein [Fuchsiella alkaliacetigena]|uniref:HD-GYP domain-containing protein n=1 Tax=Fuchsiella alkaliacetigena TaxID=957042 RepID=UPI00200A5839|nr:HD-GYP domain-containing protein [Fuchsiella alkaliacetigena]MCK8825421.1 HD-GYP domain-containing protein [Fuchsiella alkaliacetigena]
MEELNLSSDAVLLKTQLEETEEIAQAKERLLMIYIEEMEKLYQVLTERVEELDDKNQRLKELTLGVTKSLVITLEAKDRYTQGHSERVAELAKQLGKKLGFFPTQLDELHRAALFHDLGKIGIKERVLNKPGSLTEQEYNHIKEHPEIGARIITPLENNSQIIEAILHHHERIDGAGYPEGLAGEEIPYYARILAFCDTFDAMNTDRPYRDALPRSEIIKRLKKVAGKQLDAVVVESGLEIIQEQM